MLRLVVLRIQSLVVFLALVAMTVQSTLRLKKVNANLAFRRRHGLGQNLTANDQVKLSKSRKLITALLVHKELSGVDEEKVSGGAENELDDVINALICRHVYLSYVEDQSLPPCVDRERNIDSFGVEIKKNFRFEADEIRLLIKELKIPEIVIFDNRSTMPGEEVFLRGLYELAKGEVKHIIVS